MGATLTNEKRGSMLENLIERICEESTGLGNALQMGKKLPALGLRRSARLPVLAALWRCLGRPILLITDRLDRALTLSDEFRLWSPETPRLLFPEPTPLFYENAAWGEATRRDRLAALTTLAAYHIPGAPLPAAPPVIIAPARALMTRSLPRRDFLKATRILKSNQRCLIDDLVRTWLHLGYESTSTVIAGGQFARRGGLLDIWPPAEAQPIRLEFFGDEIDTLRRFDASTQRTLRTVSDDRVLVTPAREFLEPVPGLKPDLETPFSTVEIAPYPEEGFSEFHIPLLHPQPASLLDYLPRDGLVVLDDWGAISDLMAEVEEQASGLRKDFIKDGTLPAEFPIPYLTAGEIFDYLLSTPTVEFGYSLPSEIEVDEGEALALSEWFSAGPRFAGRLKPVMEHILERQAAQEKVVVVSRQSARLLELWHESQAAVPVSNTQTGTPGVDFLEGSLAEGWVFSPPDGRALHLLTDGEIFGWRRPEPRQRPRPSHEAPEAAYADLSPGDWIVHVDHGVGQFTGLVRRTVENTEREYLCIEYAEGAQLFVPVHQVDRLTRYVGPDSRPPTPSRLGGQEWKNVKAHVKEAVQEVAQDLLDLYAQRSVVKGYAFEPDTTWQEELEASFPYIETEDQMRVIAEVKRDMESARPMDRLICGDVGYGKTEVALRAAFKAVNEGKQVALLVPTTVLAQQHFHTFQQRLAAFPVQVEMLSRFRSPQQQKDIIERLALGSVDILIGTHRLLSQDVRFKDLGMLIIDEEQRFGVTHKETLKKMRTEVDVLTLTATPIPRTLYMALSGVRDISTINTPPEERLPIVTHVGPYSPKLTRQAILRELERGGQVFFVHNRVQTIGAMRSHLEKLVPEARLTVAHGQMPENELSERMDLFSKGDVDVLLSTSIIESGLDIPNANTLIVDRADTFGLAQLYQLRGRVGRGAQRAYAYFYRHNRKHPTEEGRQRLETIAENSQLGAGFNIAMRDLEIRGTGDILGTRQSGHIAAIGFHLYTRLLAESVRRLRNDGSLPSEHIHPAAFAALNAQLPSVTVELPLPVNIPAEYVPDRSIRLGLYRRMADLHSQIELDTLVEEFKDRFGPPPETVLNLLFQFKIKLLAELAGLASVGAESGQIVLRYPEGALPDNLPPLGPGVRVGKVALWIAQTGRSEWQEQLLGTLEKLGTVQSQWNQAEDRPA
jgi:transcription-repair coupling factor (superfamily II helicase)